MQAIDPINPRGKSMFLARIPEKYQDYRSFENSRFALTRYSLVYYDPS
jgi:hypothetical protein